MFKDSDGYLRLEIFRPFKELIHGFSTREFGDIRIDQLKFLNKLNLKETEVVRMNQVHGSKVCEVGGDERSKMVPETDGLFTREKGVFLRALGADCLPILFYDPENKFCGLVHLGWKGALTNLLEKTVNFFKEGKSDVQELIVGFGPGIGVCCYNVDNERADKFKEKFGELVVQIRDGKTYLDLYKANYWKLLELGLLKENMQAGVFCTKDHANLLYSNRADHGLSGEFAAVIGVRA